MSIDAKAAKEQFLKDNAGAIEANALPPFLNITKEPGRFVDGVVTGISKSKFGTDERPKMNVNLRVKATNCPVKVKDGEDIVDGAIPNPGDSVTFSAPGNMTRTIQGMTEGTTFFVEFIGTKKIKGMTIPKNVFDIRYKLPTTQPVINGTEVPDFD